MKFKMSKALRFATDEMSQLFTLRDLMQWHPMYADMNDPPTPPCHYEFMEWATCVQDGKNCQTSLDKLYKCLKQNR